MHRRSFLIGLGAAFTTLPKQVLALTENSARTLIDRLVGDINKVIDSGKSENAMIRDFERIFFPLRRYFLHCGLRNGC